MQLAKIRFYQLRRDLGPWTLIIAAAVFFIFREIAAEKAQYSWYISVIVLFALHQHYMQRKDLPFAANFFKNARWQIVLNYNLTLLPCTLALVTTNNFLPAILTHCMVIIMPWLTYNLNGPRYLFLGKLVPASKF